jgi:hypothetical protein
VGGARHGVPHRRRVAAWRAGRGVTSFCAQVRGDHRRRRRRRTAEIRTRDSGQRRWPGPGGLSGGVGMGLRSLSLLSLFRSLPLPLLCLPPSLPPSFSLSFSLVNGCGMPCEFRVVAVSWQPPSWGLRVGGAAGGPCRPAGRIATADSASRRRPRHAGRLARAEGVSEGGGERGA